MATIINDGERLELGFLDEGPEQGGGNGETVLLVHGFGSTRQVNWVNTGWIRALTSAGFRVVAFDNRGHGESTKFHREADYSLDRMAGDAIALLDFLGIGKAHVVGYSMGARITATLAIGHGERLGKVVLSGNGWGMVEGSGDWTPVRDALLAPSLDDVTDPRGRTFRIFADQTGSDRLALAACVMGVRQLLPEAALPSVMNPVLVAIGTEDDVAGDGERLAAIFPHGRFMPIPGRDHMKAVGDRAHIRGVIGFLTGEA